LSKTNGTRESGGRHWGGNPDDFTKTPTNAYSIEIEREKRRKRSKGERSGKKYDPEANLGVKGRGILGDDGETKNDSLTRAIKSAEHI